MGPEGLPQKIDAVRIAAYISSGCALFKKNSAGFVGFTSILVFLYFVGSVIGILIAGPLNSGFFIVVFKLLRHRETTFDDFFRGFRNRNYLSLSLIGLVNYLPLFLIGSLALRIPIGVKVLLLLPGIYLAVAYTFALPLVLEKKINFWYAMERSRKLISKNWFAFFALFIVLILINLIGPLLVVIGFFSLMFSGLGGVGNTSAAIPTLVLTLGCMFLGLVVLLVTIPFSFCAIAAAYADIVGLPPVAANV